MISLALKLHHILAGETALAAAGLTTMPYGSYKQVWTLYQITPITQGVPVTYYWSPFADKFFLTKEIEEGVFLPTQERALTEYMMFAHYFSEEFLIEGLQTYMDCHEDLSQLYEVCDRMFLKESVRDMWIEDARTSDWI